MLGNRSRTKARLVFVAVCLALAFSGREALYADPLDNWHIRNSSVSSSDLYGITYANGIWVAVGNNGVVTTSRDQVNWTTPIALSSGSVTEPSLKAVTFGNGLFVAVGTYIWTSPDGVKWTYRPCSASPFGGVAYGNGLFVVTGGNYRVYTGSAPPSCASEPTLCAMATSPDGITWTDRSSTSGLTTEPTVGLVFAGGKFVQLGWHQPPYYSLNGLTFTPGQGTNSSLYNHAAALGYGNGLFVFVGDYLDCSYGGTVNTSPDGITWTRYTGPAFSSLGAGTGLFLGTAGTCGSNPPSIYYAYRSTDGVNWTGEPTSVEGYGIAASPGSFTLVGGSMSILTTPDGISWTERSVGVLINATAATYGNGLFVIVGPGGKIFSSPDGSTWTSRTNTSLGTNFTSVAYGADGFIAAGSDTSVAGSGNGITWTQRTSSGGPVSALAFGNGVYVGVTGSTVYSSPDGASWTARASAPGGALNGATFGNGKFVVVGDSYVMTSSNGINWSSASSGISSRLVSVAAGNSLFAAVGDDGTTVRISTDGVSWSSVSSGLKSGSLASIAFGAGRFVATGSSSVETDSPDGKTWTARPLSASGGPWTVVYGNGTFLAISGNVILQSDPLPLPPDPSGDSPSGGGGGGGGGCFIATAAYGSDFAWQVRAFKDFRDRYLLTGPIGRAAVGIYYAASPPIAALIADRPVLKSVTRFFLTPVAYAVFYPWHCAAAFLLCMVLIVVAVRRRR